MGILKSESYRSGITLSVAFSLLAKLAALGASLALAAFFGTSAEMDVYLYVLFVVTLVTAFVSALNSAVLIPESMRLAAREGERAGMDFVNFFLYAYAALGVAAAAVFLAGPAAVFGTLSRFDRAALDAHLPLLYASLPLFPLILVSTYLVDVLASRKYFTVPMIASMATNACVLLFVLAFHRGLGALSALAGLAAAYAAQIAALLLMMRRSLGWRFGSTPYRPSRAVLVNSGFAQLGNLATALSSYVPMFLLSGLDRGTVSAMNYGRQAAEFPNNFITQQFSSVAGIKLNELFAHGRLEEADQVAVTSMKGLFFVLVPASLFGAAYAGELIGLLFGRGAFGPESVASAAGFFRLFALLLPFYAANSLVARLFLAAQKIKEAFWYQLGMNLLMAAAIAGGVARYGALGYPAALLACHAFGLGAAGLLLARYFPWVRYREAALYLFKVAALDAALLAPVRLLSGRLSAGPLAETAAAAAAYLALLALVSAALGVNKDFSAALKELKLRASGLLA